MSSQATPHQAIHRKKRMEAATLKSILFSFLHSLETLEVREILDVYIKNTKADLIEQILCAEPERLQEIYDDYEVATAHKKKDILK